MRGNEKYFSVGLIYVQDIEGKFSVWQTDGWRDGWMICNFTSFSTLFQSYQDKIGRK